MSEYTHLTCRLCRITKARKFFERTRRRGMKRCLQCIANNDTPQVVARAKCFNRGVSDVTNNAAAVKAFMICVSDGKYLDTSPHFGV